MNAPASEDTFPDDSARLLTVLLSDNENRQTPQLQWREEIDAFHSAEPGQGCCCQQNALRALQSMMRLEVDPWSTITRLGTPQNALQYLNNKLQQCADHEKMEKHEQIRKILQRALQDSGINLPTVPKKLRQIYYESRKGYWMEDNSGIFVPRDKESVRAMLIEDGFSRDRSIGGNSEVDSELLRIQNEAYVNVSGEFAGYEKGFQTVNGIRFLATTSHEKLQPKEGNWTLIDGWMHGLFGEYYSHVKAHLKLCRAALLEGDQRNGPIMIVIGPPNVGKSYFLKLVVARLLGNRSGKCKRFIYGETAFNDDLRGATIWVLDDEPLDSSPKAKRKLASALNQVSSTSDERIEPKGKSAFNLPLYRRLFLFLNPEDMDCLGSIEGRLLDKVFLIPARSFAMPDGLPGLPDASNQDEVEAFEARIKEELPCFAYALDNWVLPEDMRANRYGVKVVQDEALKKELAAYRPENELMGILQATLFEREASALSEVTMTTQEIMTAIKNGPLWGDARQLCGTVNALGARLRSLKQIMPATVSNRLAREQNAQSAQRAGRWTIKNEKAR